MATRHSATLDLDLSYVALPAAYRGQPGYVVRLALPLSELDTAIGAVRQRILGASLVSALLAPGHGVLVLPHIHAAGAAAGIVCPEPAGSAGRFRRAWRRMERTSSGRWQAP